MSLDSLAVAAVTELDWLTIVVFRSSLDGTLIGRSCMNPGNIGDNAILDNVTRHTSAIDGGFQREGDLVKI